VEQKIGPCRFSELPQQFQEQISAGTLHQARGWFTAYRPAWGDLPIAIFVALITVVPGALALLVLPMVALPLFARLLSGTANWIEFMIVMAVLGLIGVIAYFALLRPGMASVRTAWNGIQARRAQRQGREHYGLLLAPQGLLLRHGDQLQPFDCAFLPRKTVQAAEFQIIRERSGRGYRNVEVVVISYRDAQGELKWLQLRDMFATPPRAIAAAIQRWVG
jgi:hypothetical protein